MLPPGYRWHDADSRDTPGWWQLLNKSGGVVAQIQPSDGRYWITVGLDGYAHAVKTGSTVSLDRAKGHVERWAGERGVCSLCSRRLEIAHFDARHMWAAPYKSAAYGG